MSLASRLIKSSPSGKEHTQPANQICNIPDYHGSSEEIFGSSQHSAFGSRDMALASEEIEEEKRPLYVHCMIAGGIGGSTGDLLMHSLDTVKTRQQGDVQKPLKYSTMFPSYNTIWRQEGIRQGLYGGWIPAMVGSFPGTIIFFGTYEVCKRHMIDFGVPRHLAYLTSGLLGDFAASFVYVPSEVLKTRLQLQGRYNNPFFHSGYNYKSTSHAARTIIRVEGFSALFHGYRATIIRDLPYSALQFTFYEQTQMWARQWKRSRDIGLPLELVTGAGAGGLAGILTCPLDVVKTRIQTRVNPTAKLSNTAVMPSPSTISGQINVASGHFRSICTSTPSSSVPQSGAINLNAESVMTGLKTLYRIEGVAGWFRGVGPRFLWTSVQSGSMLFIYQAILRQLENYGVDVHDRSRENLYG